ncbi:MAG: aldo/keto reductase [Desulfobacterales bacterium]|nr:aldo/keto reductase [Desulfobacterales bacterium]
MSREHYQWSRRDFLKAAGIAGAGSLLKPAAETAASGDATFKIPRRPFGNTGLEVPILSFGGSLDTSLSRIVLKQAVKWGVTYWDTANSYMGGRSERAMGNYLEKYPDDRQKIFLVTKSHAWTLNGLSADLDLSLERLKTDYIDLFFLHSVRNIGELDTDTKIWAEKKKAEGKIRLFGFSTHSNMENCMLAAARLGWIDGIMTTYNYRLMHEDQMRRAVDACEKAGIGLTAMKTQGGGQVRTDSETEVELAGRFLSKGFTDAQAKLKAVWENPQIASICSEMPNMSILMANVATATDKTRLSKLDNTVLLRYARETRSGYCSGCADICESAIGGHIPVSDVMRCLMYARSYGDRYRAAKQFQKIPLPIRKLIDNTDYSVAEQRCPRKMPIGSLMREALEEMG